MTENVEKAAFCQRILDGEIDLAAAKIYIDGLDYEEMDNLCREIMTREICLPWVGERVDVKLSHIRKYIDERMKNAKQIEELENLYKFWLLYIPWGIPALSVFEDEYKGRQQRFGVVGADGRFRLYDPMTFRRWLMGETKSLLMKAKKHIIEDDNSQPANLAAFYEIESNYNEGSESLVKSWPYENFSNEVAGLVMEWIRKQTTYLENMGVQPRRAGDVKVQQTAEICALVYILDKRATGQTVPGKANMKRDIKTNYPQFSRAADTIYKRTNEMSQQPTETDCRRIAGNDWRKVVVDLSLHKEEVKQYIDNEIVEK